MASASASTEERELALINKVELRLALASGNEKLSTLLQTYLSPLLLKLASEHLSVRNKIISICQHINTRVKDPTVQLPVAALLKQFKEHPESQLIRHFDLLYIQQGFHRLPSSAKAELLPVLLAGISRDVSQPNKNGSNLFNLILQSLQHFHIPPKGSKDDEALRQKLQMSDEDGKAISFWIGRLILLLNIRRPASELLPGLTDEEYQFLTFYGRPDAWDASKEGGLHLSKTKNLVLQFLATGAFMDDDRFLPALFASADTSSVIADRGDDIMKRTISNIDLSNSGLIARLYALYLGTEGSSAVTPALQTRILSFLSRTTSSTTFPDRFSLIVTRGLAPEAEHFIRGREASKLRSAIFSYANYFLRNAKPADVASVTGPLIARLNEYINRQGWPIPEAGQELDLRRLAYELIGLSAKAGHIADLNLLDWFFRSLSEDSSGKDTAVSIEEGLSSLIGVFAEPARAENANEDVVMEDDDCPDVQALPDLLLRYMLVPMTEQEDIYRRSTRYVAVRFANRCLPYNNVVARWIDILAVGGLDQESQEVAEEGKKGLSPYWFKMQTADRSDLGETSSGAAIEFPPFSELFDTVFPAMVKDNNYDEDDAAEGIARFMKRHPSSFAPALAYCHRTFVSYAMQASGGKIDHDIDWERKVDAALSTDSKTRASIKSYIKNLLSSNSSESTINALGGFMRAALEALTWNNGAGIDGSHDIFADMLSLCPADVIQRFGFGSFTSSLVLSIKSNNEHIRSKAARSFGILLSYQNQELSDISDSPKIVNILKPFDATAKGWRSAVGSRVNEVHGAIKALAFSLGRLAYRGALDLQLKQILENLNIVLVEILQDSTDNTLLEAAYSAIEQLSIYMVYGKHLAVETKTITSMIEKISDRALAGNEKAIVALGRISVFLQVYEDEKSSLQSIDERIYQLHEIRQTEVQFSVGEALCCLASGWQSTPLQFELDVEGPFPIMPREMMLTTIMKRTIKDCGASKPSLRKASVIWLLCLIQFCGHLPEIREHLRACQAAFKQCLSDRDELVQEASSRGLGLVYEKGDRDLKDDLVRDLVGSFSDNKAQLAGNVTGETQLFEEGALPTGDGSVTTYKDILSLASEVGDASLVYRFMSLAANNSIWSSRAAFGRFGLSSVFSDSSVDGYLAENPKMYPKLYRYRFDPNPNVQRSMNDIWNALVKDSSATIEKHFDPIMDDLLQNILTKEWRVRQACCAAIAELVQGRRFAAYEKYSSQIWTLCFKVLDDIKESVRNAAASLARVLTGILVRSLEAGDQSAKSASGMLRNVLPFLLSNSGLESSAESVRLFSLRTLLQVIKKANAKILRPFIPELVERMLGLLSSLEPEAINYLHLNAAKYNLTEEKIDNMRLDSIRSSPMMEGIERCLDLLDTDSMDETIVALKNALKTTIGLPSRVGCSRVLVSLSTRHRQLFQPYADQFLGLIEKYVLDRNETVSSSYAISSGYVARLASNGQILKLAEFAKDLYSTSDDERRRAISADIINAISRHATDRFANLAVDMLPFVFIAKHDSQEDVADLCEKTWNDNVGGSRAVSLYLQEITTLALQFLDSPRWTLKHAAARAIAEATTALASGVDGVTKEQAKLLWPALRKALDGKTWDGKEGVVKAFARFVETVHDQGVRDQIAPEVLKIILREAKRQNHVYQQFSIPALGHIAVALKGSETIDWYSETYHIVFKLVDQLTSKDEDAMEVDAGSGKNNERTRDMVLTGAIEALQLSFNPENKIHSSEVEKRTNELLNLLVDVNQVRTSNVYSASFEAIEAIFAKLKTSNIGFVGWKPSAFEGLLSGLLFHTDHIALTEAVRLKRARAILALVDLDWPVVAKFVLETEGRLDKDLAGERAVVVRQVLEQAKSNEKMK